MILLYIQTKTSDLIYVKSSADNREYLVLNRPDKNAAANLIATTKTKILQLGAKLTEKYPNDPRIHRFKKRFNPDNIREKEAFSKYTSYSINKGEKIVLCLRSKDENETLVDPNTLMFVTLHEIAHIITKSIGHKPEFWDNFRFLLKEATKQGLYKCRDYNKNPQQYCGIQVTDSPLKCSSV